MLFLTQDTRSRHTILLDATLVEQLENPRFIESPLMGIIYENMNYEQVNWPELNRYADRTIFQTAEWLDFLRRTQNATPVIAAIKSNHVTVGYFTGLVFKKFGVKLLGSPFKGWTTSYMGFNLNEGVSRREVLKFLPSYVFDVLGCHYLEMVDQNLNDSDFEGLPFKVSKFTIQEVDLTKTEEELFANMQGNCRRNIRRSQQLGLTVEEADPAGFAEEYYDQLLEVFAKQNLTPTYTVERVKELIEKMYPTGRLLLLRARDKEQRSISTGVFLGFNKTVYFWGGASSQHYLFNRPNEAIMWYVMRYWKAKGVERLDLGGYAHYKKKYGPREMQVPVLMLARNSLLLLLRDVGYRAWSLRWKLSGRIKGRAGEREKTSQKPDRTKEGVIAA